MFVTQDFTSFKDPFDYTKYELLRVCSELDIQVAN